MSATHQVFNQAKPLNGFNAFTSDGVLQTWLTHANGQWASERLTRYGALVGGPLRQAGFDANHFLPEFYSHDPQGHRIDEVRFHPAYHLLMTEAIAANHPSLPWLDKAPGAHAARAALAYLHTQADPGTGCPLTMTFAAVSVLQQHTALGKLWLPKVLSQQYDPSNRPWFEKSGLTLGMAMTEKQGGSDVRANTTSARLLSLDSPAPLYALIGHKWFCSAPMCDGFLVLAQAPGGLSCFLVPRWCEDGQRNGLYFVRLKDKLGNRSNASSEVEFRDAHGYLLGEEGAGVRTIIDMVSLTRFDCMIGSAALMRQGTSEAINHCTQRHAFGAALIEQPLMQNVLADLALESEAALALVMRAAKALDQPENTDEQLLLRVLQPIGKYWICKRAISHSAEAMECLGGNGYVEQSVMPRVLRETPVNAIWEGAGNIQCLDLLRALQREPQCVDMLFSELTKVRGQHTVYDQRLHELQRDWTNLSSSRQARALTEQLAILLQASQMLEGDQQTAELFIQTRLAASDRYQFGLLPDTVKSDDIESALRRHSLQANNM